MSIVRLAIGGRVPPDGTGAGRGAFKKQCSSNATLRSPRDQRGRFATFDGFSQWRTSWPRSLRATEGTALRRKKTTVGFSIVDGTRGRGRGADVMAGDRAATTDDRTEGTGIGPAEALDLGTPDRANRAVGTTATDRGALGGEAVALREEAE